MRAALAPANELPWKPQRGPQRCSAIAPTEPQLMPAGRSSQNTARGCGQRGQGTARQHEEGHSKSRRVCNGSWDPDWPIGDMSLQGSARLLHRSQGHCFGGTNQARLFCFGIYPGSRMGFSFPFQAQPRAALSLGPAGSEAMFSLSGAVTPQPRAVGSEGWAPTPHKSALPPSLHSTATDWDAGALQQHLGTSSITSSSTGKALHHETVGFP